MRKRLGAWKTHATSRYETIMNANGVPMEVAYAR
jgi:hypothetical protein